MNEEGKPLNNRILFLGIVVGLGLWIVSPSQGEPPPKEKSSTISMDVTEAHLEDVLKLLSKESGMNFVASEEVRDKKVTLYLDQVPIHQALETIFKAHRLDLKTVEGTSLYMVTESASPKIATITKVFHLKYARVIPSAGEILPTFGLSGSLISPTFSTSGSGAGGGGAGGGGFARGGLGNAGGGGGETEAGIVKIISSLLTEHGTVESDPRTNSIIVTDIPENFKVIEETIAKLDVKPLQIFIEAEVLEVTLDTLRRLGLEYGDSTGKIGSYTGPVRTSFFPFHTGLLEKGTVTHTLGTLSFTDASIAFKLIATEKDVKFLARPRLLTLSNEVAEIRIVADAVTGVTSTSQATTGTVTETVERNIVGTILRVTPMVNEDKYITMVLEPEVSRVIQSTFNSKFQDPNRRAARTTVMVPDGGTVMIAGLISIEESRTARRIPGLGDIPILGLPFKRTDTEKKNTEIILFITPHILREGKAPVITLEDREQTPISAKEQGALHAHHQKILKERAIVDTIDNVLR